MTGAADSKGNLYQISQIRCCSRPPTRINVSPVSASGLRESALGYGG
jgi:hypothetical protein